MTIPLVLDDELVREHLTSARAVTWTKEALLARAAGLLVSPPRARSQVEDASIVFTVGASGPDWWGFRAYTTADTQHDEGIVTAWDRRSGRVAAVAIGTELGARRTGALGGVALQHLCHGQIDTLAVVGSGRQAWTQLWALSGTCPPNRVRIFSRDASRRAAFAARASAELGLDARAVESAQQAVTDADAVVLATSSSQPVVDTAWLADDVAVTTLGPKRVGGAEFAPDLVSGATFVVTDSQDQLAAYDPPAVAAELAVDVADLADVVTQAVVPPREGRRVYLSVGLSGTEVHLLGRLAQTLRQDPT